MFRALRWWLAPMPEDPRAFERVVTGDEIIGEILKNADANRFQLRRSVLLPSIYSVYLHPAELDYIRPVLPALKQEARAALAEHLQKLNASGPFAPLTRALGIENRERVEYKIADADWTLEFFADTEERLERGDIEVHSTLASAPRPEFDGAMTRQVTRKLHGDSVMQEDGAGAAPTVKASGSAEAYATLSWVEGGTPKQFTMSKAQIVLGRGGKTHWTDLKLDSAPADISREHCRIRRDERGKFFVSDSSQFGTAVDGRPAAKSPLESPLPVRATLSLAGVLEIRFEAAPK
ncbi:MAG TPA: FHA domain-containing protein [Bryobacteraceae bacterium]|nr:FHA domain-containing protein [Bryobacteraceae bacterium]